MGRGQHGAGSKYYGAGGAAKLAAEVTAAQTIDPNLTKDAYLKMLQDFDKAQMEAQLKSEAAENKPENELYNQHFDTPDYKNSKRFSGFSEASQYFINENPESNWVNSEHTDEENSALGWYCGAGFSHINKELADGNVLKEAQSLTGAFDKAVTTNAISISRRSDAMFLTQGASDTIDFETAKAMVGSTVGSKVFESSGADNHGVAIHAGSVVYHTVIPKGAKGAGMYVANSSKSVGAAENEYIVNRDSLFRINKVYMKGGVMHVERSWVGLAEHK